MANQPRSFLPPADLLDQLQGIEPGLRRLQSIGEASSLGSLATAAALIGSWAVSGAQGIDIARSPLWIVTIAAVAVVAVLLLITAWARLRLRESKSAFRYVCAVLPFQPVEFTRHDERMTWLRHDLERLLAERVSRFLFRDGGDPGRPGGGATPGSPAPSSSYIQISGTYVIRAGPDKIDVVEVTPRVAIGNGAPSALARRVKVPLRRGQEDPSHIHDPASNQRPEARTAGDEPITSSDYATILERVYFHVASQVYEQIEADVERKIALMPTAYLRGVALFHEARDYSRSNTLYAYERAATLFDRSVAELAPSLALRDPSLVMPLERITIRLDALVTKIRLAVANLVPSVASKDLIAATALMFYARSCIYRQTLALLNGSRANETFDALYAVLRAEGRIQQCPESTPGRKQALFDAAVSGAMAQAELGDLTRAREALDRARRLNPAGAEQDSRFVYALAQTINHRRTKLGTYRRAAELDPRFQMAQAQVAFCAENLWRARPEFEGLSADLVLEDYRRLLDMDPGNVAGYANAGYINWLLGRQNAAYDLLTSGRDYKEIRADAYVSELDYGLARIAAESGHFDSAYRHYVAAMVGLANESQTSQGTGYTAYHVELAGPAMQERFHRYLKNVEREARAAGAVGAPRHVRSVEAFVINDYGDVCQSRARTGNRAWIRAARAAYETASEKNPQFSLPWLNRWRLSHPFDLLAEEGPSKPADVAEAMRSLRMVQRFIDVEPSRAAGVLAEMSAQGLLGVVELGRVDAICRDGAAAESLDLEVAEHATRAVVAWQRVLDLAARALPHEWLWDVAPSSAGRFRWDAIPEASEPDLRWLRDIGPVGVECLFELGNLAYFVAKRRGNLQAARNGHPHHDEQVEETLRMLSAVPGWHPSGDDPIEAAEPTSRQLAQLYRFLTTWYRPSEMTGLESLLALAPTAPSELGSSTDVREIRVSLRAALDQVLTNDPWSSWAYKWISVAYDENDKRLRRYRSFIHDEDELPMSIYLQLGDELGKYGDDELAHHAYIRAAETKTEANPDDLWDLADRLHRGAGDPSAALSAVKAGRALDASSDDPFRSQRDWEVREAVLRYEQEPDDALKLLRRVSRTDNAEPSGWRQQVVTELIRNGKDPVHFPRTASERSLHRLERWLEADRVRAKRQRNVASFCDAAGAERIIIHARIDTRASEAEQAQTQG